MKSRSEKQKAMHKKFIIRRACFLLILICLIVTVSIAANLIGENFFPKDGEEVQISEKPIENIPSQTSKSSEDTSVLAPVQETILMTFAGDCTLGTDTNFNYSTSLPAVFEANNRNYSYFFKNVYDIFSSDDYTMVNLETTFTDATAKSDKGSGTVFHFKGPKDYVNILTSSSIEGVTIANNHMNDYGKTGLNDTIETLSSAGVDFCGKGHKIEKEIKGVKFLFLGYEGWTFSENLKETIASDIKYGKDKGAIVIPYFHWGIERQYEPYDVQINLAHYSIDNGADMVLGSHPHVIQSLENYKNKLIVYSFGNFSFGGNSNPSDKRTFILQLKASAEDGSLNSMSYRVIPASISSVDYKNDYAPSILSGDKKAALLEKLNSLSPTLNGRISDEFFSLE